MHMRSRWSGQLFASLDQRTPSIMGPGVALCRDFLCTRFLQPMPYEADEPRAMETTSACNESSLKAVTEAVLRLAGAGFQGTVFASS